MEAVISVTCERFEYDKKNYNPIWEDLPSKIQDQLNDEEVVAIERVPVMIFGKESFRYHLYVLGCRKPLTFNKQGKRLS